MAYRERGLSARRAGTLFEVARSALSYESRKAALDAPVIARMQALSAQYPRYGYSFIGKFRDECLSLEWLRSRAEAKIIIESWRQHYNTVRPHSSLGYLTPNEFVAHQTTQRLARQRAGSLRYWGLRAPARCTNRLVRGTCSKHGMPSQANRGPKKLGRSGFPGGDRSYDQVTPTDAPNYFGPPRVCDDQFCSVGNISIGTGAGEASARNRQDGIKDCYRVGE